MFWRCSPSTPQQDPTVPVAPSVRQTRRPSESYLLPTPVEAHPPLLPPKDHLHEIYRPGPEFEQGGRVEGGRKGEMSFLDRSAIQVASKESESRGYKPIPTLDTTIDKSRFLVRTPTPPPKPPKSIRGSTATKRVSHRLDEVISEVKSYLQELDRMNVVTDTKEVVQSPSSTTALRFFESDTSKSKVEDEVKVEEPSSTRAMRFFEPSCPQIDLKLPSEGFSIDWGL